MLQVMDKKSGKEADVRLMLGIKGEDIKDEKLREKMSQYSMGDQEKAIDMGFYFNELNTLEFDMGEVGEDQSIQRTTSKNLESWQDWWTRKMKQNEMLRDAIIQNNVAKVRELLVEDAENKNADVNCAININGFKLSPLLLAIQSFYLNQKEADVIQELLKNYADINCFEQNLGFSPLIMAAHLNNEVDAVYVTQILCNHRLFEGQPKIIDVDAVDLTGNTALHHAALTNKINLVKYLIQE